MTSIEEFITDVMGHSTQQEIDYVMKNKFRLDPDQSGKVSFKELGNFLFTRHCGEMSLQKMHREGKMKYGSDRKMLPE